MWTSQLIFLFKDQHGNICDALKFAHQNAEAVDKVTSANQKQLVAEGGKDSRSTLVARVPRTSSASTLAAYFLLCSCNPSNYTHMTC